MILSEDSLSKKVSSVKVSVITFRISLGFGFSALATSSKNCLSICDEILFKSFLSLYFYIKKEAGY